jgi:hypothetical protein
VAPGGNEAYSLAIRLGKFVEFSKGQTAIAVPNLEKLLP